jgi:hypothetical protein
MSLARAPARLFFLSYSYSSSAPASSFPLLHFPVIYPMQCWPLHNLRNDAYPWDGIGMELNGWYGALIAI